MLFAPLPRNLFRRLPAELAMCVCVCVCVCPQLPSRNLELEMTVISSNDHVEMNPSDVGNNDRCCI